MLTGGGQADVLYSKLLGANEKLQQEQNEVQRLKVQIEEANKQTALQSKMKNELKDDQQEFNRKVQYDNQMKERIYKCR